MLEFVIVFILIGLIIGFVTEFAQGLIIVIGISILWFFVSGPWAIATFLELGAGLTIAEGIKQTKN